MASSECGDERPTTTPTTAPSDDVPARSVTVGVRCSTSAEPTVRSLHPKGARHGCIAHRPSRSPSPVVPTRARLRRPHAGSRQSHRTRRPERRRQVDAARVRWPGEVDLDRGQVEAGAGRRRTSACFRRNRPGRRPRPSEQFLARRTGVTAAQVDSTRRPMRWPPVSAAPTIATPTRSIGGSRSVRPTSTLASARSGRSRARRTVARPADGDVVGRRGGPVVAGLAAAVTIRRRSCSTSRPTTSISTGSTASRSGCSGSTAPVLLVSHDRRFSSGRSPTSSRSTTTPIGRRGSPADGRRSSPNENWRASTLATVRGIRRETATAARPRASASASGRRRARPRCASRAKTTSTSGTSRSIRPSSWRARRRARRRRSNGSRRWTNRTKPWELQLDDPDAPNAAATSWSSSRCGGRSWRLPARSGRSATSRSATGWRSSARTEPARRR